MNELLSFSSGVALLIVSLLVMKAYWPSGDRLKASSTLGLAIFLAFASDATNTLWWQIGGVIDRDVYDWFPYDYREVGQYLDTFLKGSAAFAGVLHLVALKQTLPDKEQKRWPWYEMPWYPDKPCFRSRRKDDE